MSAQAVEPSELLDLLIVGGGPAGTAAAFRAKELGIHALVIDFDDLLKRIRDYSKDKLILPDFGGGDKMKFPAGGDLITSLHFRDIDKDEMCETWKGFYRTFDVPARVGVELTGLSRGEDGTWAAKAWNHQTSASEAYRARYVVLAPGRGVPRRFDIPGNTEGIAYRLDDPRQYVEGPVCVIGGGTSAAEAVIAISNVKQAAKDPCPVVWSYRGAQMPRISKALAETFFEAYFGNGNVRYHPFSEPVAVVHGPDRIDYLSLLVERKTAPDRPPETTHLEFPKNRCVACIGEDIPESFLRELGIHMVAGGEGDKKMMAVSSLLETQQPGVFLIGDLLSQAYLETERFDADPSTFQRIKHRGNIKSSLRDGVFVAEIIKQKLEGRQRIEVVIRDAEPAMHSAPSASPADLLIRPVPGGEVRVDAVDGTRVHAAEEDHSHFVRISETGVEEGELPLSPLGVTRIGREGCDLNFPNDPIVSLNHASVTRRNGKYVLRDDGSTAGTFLRLRHGHPRRLATGDLIRVGRQILVLQDGQNRSYIQQYAANGKAIARHELGDRTLVFGRAGGKANPDVILADGDMTLSRFHVSFSRTGDSIVAEDFNSRNGTYLRVSDSVELAHGDEIRLGRQILRLILKVDAPVKTGSAPFQLPGAIAKAPIAAPTGIEAKVTFAGTGVTYIMQPSQSILDIADEHDVELDHECWVGKCGCDLIRIVEGREFLNEVSEQESKTIKRRGAIPGDCRLACMTRVSGPVVVAVVE